MTRQTSMGIRQLAVWAGVIGPILFIAIFTVEGFLRSDYNPISTYISDLSIGPRGIIQIVNFFIFAALFFIFSYGLSLEYRTRNQSLNGPRILMLMAILFFLTGIFVTDPIHTPLFEMTWQGIVHNIIGFIIFSLFPISCYVFWRAFREHDEWKSFQKPTLVVGVMITVGLLAFAVALIGMVLTPNALTDYIGLIQRIDIITFLLWVVALAWNYRKHLHPQL
ncbi:MAG: DUF998 domain-containing protein [Candidatus Odinarchaeota archaeon]